MSPAAPAPPEEETEEQAEEEDEWGADDAGPPAPSAKKNATLALDDVYYEGGALFVKGPDGKSAHLPAGAAFSDMLYKSEGIAKKALASIAVVQGSSFRVEQDVSDFRRVREALWRFVVYNFVGSLMHLLVC